jgi:hypothetical protein
VLCGPPVLVAGNGPGPGVAEERAASSVPFLKWCAARGGVMKILRCCFGRVCFVAGLAGGLSVVAMVGSAASASSSGDVPGRVQSAHGPAAVASGGAWGIAEEVPGTGILNAGDTAQTSSVSCAAAGNCAAGGFYTDSSGLFQAFVVNEVNGVWRTAKEVPGTAALNTGGDALTRWVSCAAAGNCAAGGSYTDPSGHFQAFVVNEVNGVWRTAKEVPGTAALNTGGSADTSSVSCAAAGNCSAGGFYTEPSGHRQGFVVNEVNGVWRTAKEVPGTAALNTGGDGFTASVSCAAAGNCSAGGFYTDPSGHRQAFVVNEVNGVWRTAKEIPGTAALNTGGDALTASVSCAAAGNCSAGGSYTDPSGRGQGFVVNEVNGVWRTAKEVPGTAALNTGGSAQTASVSCASAGNCSAGGSYTDPSGHFQAFVVNEVNGVWRTAREVPGTATLNNRGNAAVLSVSCAMVGNCSAGGFYTESSGRGQAFVVNRS